MKAILEFDLDKEEDSDRYHEMTKARDMYLALHLFRIDVIRKLTKYDIPEEIETKEALLNYISNKFYEILDEYSLDIE